MEKPFIQLFRTPNGCYFLDVNKNELVPISGPSFRYLSEVMSGKRVFADSAPQELKKLKAQGYLSSESVVKNVRHPYSRLKEAPAFYAAQTRRLGEGGRKTI